MIQAWELFRGIGGVFSVQPRLERGGLAGQKHHKEERRKIDGKDNLGGEFPGRVTLSNRRIESWRSF